LIILDFITYSEGNMFALLLLIVILQQPFQIRSLIEYLSCELRIGSNPPVPIVLQGRGLIYSLSHTSLPVRKCSSPKSGLCVCVLP